MEGIVNASLVVLPTIDDDSSAKQKKYRTRYHEEGASAIEPWKQYVPTSDEGGKDYKKHNFCMFCLALHIRLDRHLVSHHADKKEVQVIIDTPVGSLERRRKLELVRLKGNEIFNKDRTLHPEGKLICPRRMTVRKLKQLLEAPISKTDTDDGLLQNDQENSQLSLPKSSLLFSNLPFLFV